MPTLVSLMCVGETKPWCGTYAGSRWTRTHTTRCESITMMLRFVRERLTRRGGKLVPTSSVPTPRCSNHNSARSLRWCVANRSPACRPQRWRPCGKTEESSAKINSAIQLIARSDHVGPTEDRRVRNTGARASDEVNLRCSNFFFGGQRKEKKPVNLCTVDVSYISY